MIAIFTCIGLGLYLSHKGKKSATEPIEAEIIDINFIKTSEISMYCLTLKYIVNGVEYINKNTKGFEHKTENMVIGNKIMIKYNPKNPNDIDY